MADKQDKKPSKKEAQQEKLILQFKRVFSGADGEAVLRALMAEFHIIDGTFSENSNRMYFREGERNVVKTIMEKVDIDMGKFRQLFQETQDDYSMEDV